MKARAEKRRIALVNEQMLDIAAAAYGLAAELDNPAPDYVMRHWHQRRLQSAIRRLTFDSRSWLSDREKQIQFFGPTWDISRD